MLSIIAAITIAMSAQASDLLGPIWHLQGKHIGDADPLSWTIEYFDDWGRTVVDANGGHFYHDRCCGGYQTDDPSWMYPESIWGQYPMYYIGTTMRYKITLTNNSNRTYKNLRVVAIQEYLSEGATWGEWIGPDAAKDWYVEELLSGQTLTFEGTLYIPWGAEGGLDQTHLQVQHWDKGQGMTGRGAVIIDDAKANIWCPPKDGAPGADSGAVTPTGSASVRPATGGSVAVFELKPVGTGSVSVSIYDRRGILVNTISTAGSGTLTLSWDGKSYSGRSVAPGMYLAVITGPGIRTTEKVAVLP